MGNFRENRMDQNATKKEPYDPKQKKELLIGSISHSKPKRISHIKFGMLSGADMVRAAEIQVCSRPLYHMGTREPVMNGVLDPRLGVSDKTSLCATCNQKLSDCTGHFGYIRLELPVFHIGYYKALQNVLQCVCKDCSRILLPPAERAKYLKSMTNPSRDSNQRANLRKKIIDLCKRNVICHCCGSVNGVVKKISGAASLKLIHEKYKSKKFINNEELFEEYRSGLETAIESNAEILQHVEKAQESLNPKVVLDILSEIPDEDLPLLWADPVHSRPERMVLTHIMVPPVAIRPSVKMDAGQGSNEDDLSVKLQEIVQFNHALQQKIQQGATMKVVQEYWDFLQVQVAQFFNGELPGLPPAVRANKPIRGLVQRMKGKQGRFRGNLSGKRVDFSGRTVISPDPNLSVHQVGVPVLMSMRLTYPEVVTRYNKEKLQELVIRGAKEYPGANYVRQDMGKGYTKMLEFIEDRRDIAQGLRYGDIVERHLEDGDIVLFNRQPSLHKMSIMSHVIKVLPGRTLRFNECVCAPYNADFDGDEMNLHVPQTEEARTEALELMGVRHNLITPRNGEPLVCATQDFITASYLMTQKDVFLTRDQVCQVASYLGDAAEHVELPEPTILKPVRLWTGKQIWGMLLNPRPSESYEQQTLVNLEAQERHYVGDPKEGNCMCPLDGYVIFRNSELICGQLGKGVLGGSKSGLVYVLIRDHGHMAASKGMNRMTKCVTRWLSESGFTIGIDDVTPDETLLAGKHKAIQYGYDEVDKIIAKYDNGTLETRPGCNLEESLESEVSRILNEVRDKAGKMCMQNLPRDNKPFIMATCGSKGSALNICQMVACVGQQIVGGSRMPNGFMRRSLPHFHLDAKDPSAKGFVANSFYSGLNPPEFFFHTMGGREGLVDTAVKTAETGYMARRLMKALEDLSIRYDGSVRNSSNGVVQFTYGDDGLNPACMEKGDRPVNFTRLLNHVCASFSCGDEAPLSGDVIRTLAKSEIGRHMQVVKDFRATQTAVGRLKRSHAVSSGEKVESLYINNKLLVNGALVNGIEFFLEELGSALDNIASQVEDMEQLVKQDPDAQVVQQVLSCARRVTKTHLSKFIDAAIEKYQLAVTEPGEAVGAIGAQSLGEPGTQMTLKTFHFAGVASMNVTLGVPRIKEIINASKLISTPIITVGLDCNNDERSARIVKGRIERTTLGEVADFIEERYTVDGAYIEVQLSAKVIRNLHLDITPDTVRSSILNSAKLKLGPDNISLKVLTGGGSVVVRVPNDYGEKATRTRKLVAEAQHNLFYSIQMLKAGLQQVIVQGIPSVQRAVVNIDEGSEKKGSKRYHLLVEGLGLQHVMGIPGVNGKKTRTNHIMEMEKVLGIEAARKLVMEEVDYIFKQYGLGIDVRHLMLLADVMSYRGQILGITRFGIAKMKESVLMLASFEKTSDHLFDAAVHSRQDEINGVSECIIMGTPIPLGTGSFKLLSTWDSALHKENGLGLQIRNTIDL